jgi:hypothetical protein
MALAQYTLQVQRLLHDPNFQYFQQAELTDYINEARNRVCKDTRCLRCQAPGGLTLTAGVEQYLISAISLSASPIAFTGCTPVDVMGVTVIWGSTRIKLGYDDWTRFDAKYRYWTNMQSRPVGFTRVGGLSIYIGPQPDQTYVADLDVSLIPPPLVTGVYDTELIPEPFTTGVQYYAAYKAKFRQQAMGEAKLFHDMYIAQMKRETVAFMQRIIPDPYAR